MHLLRYTPRSRMELDTSSEQAHRSYTGVFGARQLGSCVPPLSPARSQDRTRAELVEGRMKRSHLFFGFALLAALLLGDGRAVGQQVTAVITGQVTDPSGAPITGASITARDVDRGTTFTDQTNGDGSYNFPRVPPGKYELRATAKGFQTAVRSGLELAMNQTAKADFAMTLGQVSETVEVTASAPLLQTQSTDVGRIIDGRTNVDLPLATRNSLQLTLLAPGSIHPDPSTFKNGQTTGGSGRPNVNGNREQANNFMLDGLDNNQVSDNLAGYTPGVEAIQEFNEIPLPAPADFGNYMGAVISTSIKSG